MTKQGDTKGSNKKYDIVTNSGAVVRLTRAQQKYADLKLADPDRTLISVASEAYPNAQPNTLSQIANQNENNLAISIYSSEQVNKAIVTIAGLLDSKNPKIQLSAAQDILDRDKGKAVARTEINTTNVNLNIEASQELAGDFLAFVKQKTIQPTSS